MSAHRKAWQTTLDQFADTRQETLKLVEGLSQEQFNYSPSDTTWSSGEIIDHILLAEKLYRTEISELIRLKKAGKRTRLRRTFQDIDVSVAFLPKSVLPLLELPFTLFNLFVPSLVREMMTRFVLIPATNPGVSKPHKGRSTRELREDLQSSMKKTQALFESNPDLDYRQMVHDHPLMGANDVLQLLRIGIKHEQRHQDQIRDLKARPAFPKSG